MTKLSNFIDRLPASGRTLLATAGVLATLVTAQTAHAGNRTWEADNLPFIAKADERITTNLRSLQNIVRNLKRIPFEQSRLRGEQQAQQIQTAYVNAVARAPYRDLAAFDHFNIVARRGVPNEARIERMADDFNMKRDMLLQALEIVDRMDRALAMEDFSTAERLLDQADSYLSHEIGQGSSGYRNRYVADTDQYVQPRTNYTVQQNVYQQNLYEQPYRRHESFKHRIEDAIVNSLAR